MVLYLQVWDSECPPIVGIAGEEFLWPYLMEWMRGGDGVE